MYNQFPNAYTDEEDNAYQIIANIMTAINLTANIVSNPFTTPDQSNKEVIILLNNLITDLTKENEFTQIKRKCVFKTYKSWKPNETIQKGESRINDGIRYLCINPGLSDIEPKGNGVFTMNTTVDWQANTSVLEGAQVKSDMSLWQAMNSGITGNTQPTGNEDTNDGNIIWKYIEPILYWENKGTEINKYPFKEICPDFRALCPGTMINKTNTRIMAPLLDQDIQNLRVYNISTPSNFYYISEQSINLFPEYPEDVEIEFIYYSKRIVIDKNGILKQYFTENEDKALIPSNVLKYGTCYKWKMMKSMEYAKYEQLYNEALFKALSENKEPVIVDLTGSKSDAFSPVPFQNWVIKY